MMAELLRKEDMVYANDGVNVLPIEVELVDVLKGETERKKIVMIPLLPEKWKNLAITANEMLAKGDDFDGWMISQYLIEPKLSLSEAKFMKVELKSLICRTILKCSGYPIDEILVAAQKIAMDEPVSEEVVSEEVKAN